MEYDAITKPPADHLRVRPNLVDYEQMRADFSWDNIRQELDGLPGGGLNIAYEASTATSRRRVATSRRSSGRARTASRRRYTFAEMTRRSNKCGERPAQPRRQEGRPRLRLPRPHPGAVLRRVRHAEGRRRHRAAVLRLRPGRGRATVCRQRRERAPDQPRALGARQGHPRRPAGAEARRARDAAASAAEASEGIAHLGRPRGQAIRRVRDRGDGPRRLLGHALHLRHDRQAEGRGARAPGGLGPLRDRQVRARPPRRGHLLVHRRPGLGHRHLLRHVRAVDQRRDDRHLRGRLRRRRVVRDHREVQGHGLVHGADRDPAADEGRRRRRPDATTSPACATRCRSASR